MRLAGDLICSPGKAAPHPAGETAPTAGQSPDSQALGLGCVASTNSACHCGAEDGNMVGGWRWGLSVTFLGTYTFISLLCSPRVDNPTP